MMRTCHYKLIVDVVLYIGGMGDQREKATQMRNRTYVGLRTKNNGGDCLRRNETK